MKKVLKNSVIILALGILISLMVPYGQAFAEPEVKSQEDLGARIEATSCDPGADPLTDDQRTEERKDKFPYKSCVGQALDMNNFHVLVSFKPNDTFVGIMMSIFAGAGGAAGPLTSGGLVALPAAAGYAAVSAMSALVLYALPREEKWIKVGHTEDIHKIALFEVRIEADMACTYVKPLGMFEFPISKAEDFIQRYNLNSDEGQLSDWGEDKENSLPAHCVYLPKPAPALQPPDWGTMVSATCTDYNVTASQFKYPDGENRSFIGVAMQCIEETMMNLFYYTHNDGSTFFTRIQERLKGIIRGLLALYVIFFGYRFIIAPGPIKQEEWMWFAIKVGLVWYFAAGSGMIDSLPKLQSFTKGTSIILMEAGMGDHVNEDAALESVIAAETDVEQKYSLFVQARANLAADRTDSSLLEAYEIALANYRNAVKALREANNIADSFGYKYCDFRPFEEAGLYRYEDTDAYGQARVRDLSYMKLWDMMDCKISKYLGVGDNADSLKTPHVLVIAVGAIFSHVFGIAIFFLTIIFLIFIILIIVRVVEIYIMAFIALVLLVYISPLIIPAVLFEYSKNIFETWLKQIISYSVQPIMMFGFLAFLFAVYDTVIYDGNHNFVPMTPPEHTLDENKIILEPDKYGDMVCNDEDAIGCIYQTVNVDKKEVIFGLNLYTTDMNYAQGRDVMIGLLKIILASFVAYAVLGLIEEMATSMTNAAGGGAVSISTVQSVGPVEIAQQFKKVGAGAVGAAKVAGKAAGGTVKRKGYEANAKNAKARALKEGGEKTKRPGKVDPFANHRDKPLPKPPRKKPDIFEGQRNKPLPKPPGKE